MIEKFSPELIEAVESAFAPGHVPHETKILRILAAVVPVVRQECGADDMRKALERISDLSPNRANARTADDLYATVKAIADTALATARGEGV